MKRLLIVTLAFLSLNALAQDGQTDQKSPTGFTAEQMATLQTKRMALDLDLDESQQRKLQSLNLNKALERRAHKERMRERRHMEKGKPNAVERFNSLNGRLDKALTHKAEMKNILNKDQYARWEKSRRIKQVKRKQIARRKMMKRKRRVQVKKRH